MTAILFFGVTAWAFAQGNNIINACVAKDGTVRIVALEDQCKDKETPLSWNIMGEPGPQGEPGPTGVLGFYTVTSEQEVPGQSINFGAIARCDVGDAITGGGHRFLDPAFGQVGFASNAAVANHPVPAEDSLGEGWEVRVWNSSDFKNILEVSAICADLTP